MTRNIAIFSIFLIIHYLTFTKKFSKSLCCALYRYLKMKSNPCSYIHNKVLRYCHSCGLEVKSYIHFVCIMLWEVLFQQPSLTSVFVTRCRSTNTKHAKTSATWLFLVFFFFFNHYVRCLKQPLCGLYEPKQRGISKKRDENDYTSRNIPSIFNLSTVYTNFVIDRVIAKLQQHLSIHLEMVA